MSEPIAPPPARSDQQCADYACKMPLTISAELLNAHCACVTLDRAQLDAALAREFDDAFSADSDGRTAQALRAALANERPNLFSETTVFISAQQAQQMADFVAAHQRITELAGWREAAFADAPEAALHPSAAQGVLMGYDFHLTEKGAQLIEINTNAGGALLNMMLARVQLRCCGVPDATLS